MLVGYLEHPHEVSEAAGSVVEELAARGIKFDRVLVDVLPNNRYDWATGRWRDEEGFMHYFMRGNTDVGWFCTVFGNLNLQRRPRLWGREALARTKDITHRYSTQPCLT